METENENQVINKRTLIITGLLKALSILLWCLNKTRVSVVNEKCIRCLISEHQDQEISVIAPVVVVEKLKNQDDILRVANQYCTWNK